MNSAGAQSTSYLEEVPEALDRERVDRLVSFVADVSRNEAASLIENGYVTLDGNVATKGSKRVEVGTTISVEVPVRDHSVVADPDIDIPIVYDDEHVLVVDKPAGLVVHPGAGVKGQTMVNGLLARFPDLASVGEPHRPGIVHRLDKDTTGLLMVARTASAYEDLVAQLKSRSVRREYEALAFGVFDSDSGTIDAPLGRSERDATRQAVILGGRSAITHYEVVSTLTLPAVTQVSGPAGRQTHATILRCWLETGRTHQIRVHLASIGHPIVGDIKYGGTSTLSGRPFLHAAKLGFFHPSTGDELSFTSELPDDLSSVVQLLSESDDEGTSKVDEVPER